MLHVNHPNVLRLMEIFEDEKWFYLVMEYMQGGELFEKIVQRGRYSERDAAFIFKQIASGVQYLHGMGIAHRFVLFLLLIFILLFGLHPSYVSLLLAETSNPRTSLPLITEMASSTSRLLTCTVPSIIIIVININS